jgi:hypothetical protein
LAGQLEVEDEPVARGLMGKAAKPLQHVVAHMGQDQPLRFDIAKL